MTESFNFAEMKLFFLTFADLIADGAAGFAGTLARRLTFAATALLNRRLKIRLVDCLDVFHVISSQKILSRAINYEVSNLFERKAYGSFQRQRQINPRRINVSLCSRATVVNRVRGTNNFYRGVNVGSRDFVARDKFFQCGSVITRGKCANHRQGYHAAFQVAAVRFARNFFVAEEIQKVVNDLEREPQSGTVSRQIFDFAVVHCRDNRSESTTA